MHAMVQRSMKDKIGGPDRKRYAGNIKDNLLYLGPAAPADERLRQDRSTANKQGLTEIQLNNANQDEEKIDGNRTRDLRQVDLEPRGDNRNQEIGDELGQIRNGPGPCSVKQCGETKQANGDKKQLRPS